MIITELSKEILMRNEWFLLRIIHFHLNEKCISHIWVMWELLKWEMRNAFLISELCENNLSEKWETYFSCENYWNIKRNIDEKWLILIENYTFSSKSSIFMNDSQWEFFKYGHIIIREMTISYEKYISHVIIMWELLKYQKQHRQELKDSHWELCILV